MGALVGGFIGWIIAGFFGHKGHFEKFNFWVLVSKGKSG